MMKTTQREIRAMGNEHIFWERLKAYQKEHNTTGVPGHAGALGLRCIAYSVGVYGVNGTAYVTEDGTLVGVGSRGYNVYVR